MMKKNQKVAVLCVDDESMILTSLKKQLRQILGNQIVLETADSALEGLEIIEELQEDGIEIALIISDWLMPEMKGDEFLNKVHESLPQVPKLLLSGQVDKQAIERIQDLPSLNTILYKPWQEQELQKIILDSLEKK